MCALLPPSQAWDDVVRKEKPREDAFEYKKRLTLDHEKSKLSLAEIYEQEYIRLSQVRRLQGTAVAGRRHWETSSVAAEFIAQKPQALGPWSQCEAPSSRMVGYSVPTERRARWSCS